MATPVLAFVCDGAVYDVAALETAQDTPHWAATDFHTRVCSLSCAGLGELYERVRAGHRPTEARLPPGSYLPLAPCDTDRAAYLQLSPYDRRAQEPAFALRDARGLLGDHQPIAFPAQAPMVDVEAGLAAILREDLWRATPAEVDRAVLGYTLVLDWTAWPSHERWDGRPLPLDPPSQLGPALVTREELGGVAKLRAVMQVGSDEWTAGTVGDWTFPLAEAIAFISQHLPLQTGDVVGLGALPLGSPSSVGRTLAYGERVTLRVEGLAQLTGWAVAGPPPGPWRRQR